MIVVDRMRRRVAAAGHAHPSLPEEDRGLFGHVFSMTAGALTFPARKLRRREAAQDIEVPPPPTDEEIFNARLGDLAAQGQTAGYMLQACVAQLDLLVHPQERTPPLKAPRTTLAVSLRVKRDRHYHASPAVAKRAVPAISALTLVAPAIILASVYGIFQGYAHFAGDYTEPDAVALGEGISGARIYDRNGEFLYQFIDDQAGVQVPVELAEVSSNMLAATIATEDASFYTNPGINPRGIVRAGWENFGPFLKNEAATALEGSGGSSITQQLVKNLYIEPEERHKRSWERKIREAAYALELTNAHDKDQILQWYLNMISYGGIYNGVEAASQGYFGKPAAELSLAQAAMLAGIPQSPALYDPINRPEAAKARRNQVLDLIAERGTVQIGTNSRYTPSPEDIEAAKAEPLGVEERTYTIDAPHFVLNHIAPELEGILGPDAVYKDGLVVTTTLDLSLQQRTKELLEKWILEYEQISNSHNGAVVVMDNRTGEILVFIGSRDYYNDAIDGKVNNITALNSPGSSFKPFVYLASFMKLGWKPSTIIADTPVSVRQADGSYFQPQNPSVGSYMGNIPISIALGNSLNVPPFKAAMQTGIGSIIEIARRTGFTTLDGEYGPSIALGGVDLTALDLTYGYSVLANNGVMIGVPTTSTYDEGERALDPVSILKVEDSKGNVIWEAEEARRKEQVVPAQEAYEITSILSNGQNQCATFGCGGISIPGRAAGVKTGTSEPYDPEGPDQGKIGDTWAFGYTPDYVVGVWAGNANNEPVTNILSTSISYRVMREALEATYGGRPSGPFPEPSGGLAPGVCDGPGCSQDDGPLAVRPATQHPGETLNSPAAPFLQTNVTSSPRRRRYGRARGVRSLHDRPGHVRRRR